MPPSMKHIFLLYMVFAMFGYCMSNENDTVIDIISCNQLNDLLPVDNANPSCKCYDQGLAGCSLWLGCYQENDARDLLNFLTSFETVTHIPCVKVWASVVPFMTDQFFVKIRVRKLVIDSSGLGLFYSKPFGILGSHLEMLDLTNNPIRSLRRDTFVGLSHLRFLDLSGNRFQELTNPAVFEPLQSLEQLSLHGNQISNLSDSLFANLTLLKSLDLHSNELQEITRRTFEGLSNLEMLDLSKNQISIVEDGAFDFVPNLKSLNLGDNRLSHVSITGLASLTSLKLHSNVIRSEIALKMAYLPTLESLYLDSNSLAILGDSPKLYTAMPGLKVLSAAQNQIETVHVDSLPPVLEKLLLQYNYINESPGNGWGPASLSVLHLGHNRLTGITNSAFAPLHNLETLGLGFNQIARISAASLLNNTKLQRFYLNSNLLASVPDELVLSLPSTLIAADFSGNMWNCSCSLVLLAMWMRDHDEAICSLDMTQCSASTDVIADLADVMQDQCIASHFVHPWLNTVAIIFGVASIVLIIGVIVLVKQLWDLQSNEALQFMYHPSGTSDKAAMVPRQQTSPAKLTTYGVRNYDASRPPDDLHHLLSRKKVCWADETPPVNENL